MRRNPRGSAVLTPMAMIAVILGMLAGLISYALSQRKTAINYSRNTDRLTCAESGLLMARAYFGRNFTNWNAFLSQPNIYNPIRMATWNNPPADISDTSTLRTSNPE